MIVELDINPKVVAFVCERSDVPLLYVGYSAIPNLVVEFNDCECVRHTAFAYVEVSYDSTCVVDYTTLINTCVEAIVLHHDPRVNLSHVTRSDYITKVVSTLGTANSLDTSVKGLYALVHEPQEQLDLVEPPTHSYLTVFSIEALMSIVGAEPAVYGLTYDSVITKDRRVLVTHHADTHYTNS